MKINQENGEEKKKEAKPKQFDLSARGTHRLWLSDLSESVARCLPLSAPKSTPVPLGVSLPLLLAPADYADWVKWNF